MNNLGLDQDGYELMSPINTSEWNQGGPHGYGEMIKK